MIKRAHVKKLTGLLETMEDAIHGVEASSVVSVDGFMIASELPHTVQEDRVAAMSAAMLSLGRTAVRELACGELSEVYMKGENGYIVVMASGENAVLTAIAGNGAELSLVHPNMKRTAAKVAELV